MERVPAELIYLVLIGGYVLFNWLMQQAAQRRQQEEQAREGEAAAPDETPPFEEEAADYRWGRAAVTETAPAPLPVPRPALAVPPAAPRHLHPVRALLKDKRDLRRAVILTMVLEPCRAQVPPDQR